MRSCGIGLGAVLLGLGQAHAAPAPAPDQDLTPTARTLSDKGLREYEKGDLDAAIESFMGAYALSNNSGLLFNVAQAYRRKKDCAQAKEYYGRYLAAAPDTALKSSAERRLAEMETCLKAAGSDPAPAPPGGASTIVTPEHPKAIEDPPPPVALVEDRRPPATAPNDRAIAWTLRGSAAALLTTSAIFGVLSWKAKNDFDATTLQRPAMDADDRFQLDATLAITFAASGLACAAVSYFVGRQR